MLIVIGRDWPAYPHTQPMPVQWPGVGTEIMAYTPAAYLFEAGGRLNCPSNQSIVACRRKLVILA